MDTDEVQAVAFLARHTVDHLRQQMTSLVGLARALAWQGPDRDAWVRDAERVSGQCFAHLDEADVLLQRLLVEVEEWSQMAQPGDFAGLVSVSRPGWNVLSLGESRPDLSAEELINQVSEWLKPIDWIADRPAASKQFYAGLRQIGRWLNGLGQTRGYVSQMEALGHFLEGSSQAAAALANVISLKDFQRYFAGELTNAQIAVTAVATLVDQTPVGLVPFLGQQIGQWMAVSVPDPGGTWRGVVPPVY